MDAMPAHEGAHSRTREFPVDDQACSVGQPKQFDQMQQIARALLTADHHEMILKRTLVLLSSIVRRVANGTMNSTNYFISSMETT